MLKPSHLLDEDGRPIEEGKCPEDLRPPGVPFEMRSCSYADSRLHHANPMNTSALKQVTRHLDAGLECLRWLKATVLDSGAAGGVSYRDLWQVVHAAGSLPVFLLQRSGESPDAYRVPRLGSVVAKLAFGMRAVFKQLSLRDTHESDDTLPALTPQALLAYIDQEGQLIGPEEVCAGSPRQIERTLSALLLDEGPSQAGELGPLLQDVRGFQNYAFARFSWEIIQISFFIVRHCLVEDLTRALSLLSENTGNHSVQRAKDLLPRWEEGETQDTYVRAIAHAMAKLPGPARKAMLDSLTDLLLPNPTYLSPGAAAIQDKAVAMGDVLLRVDGPAAAQWTRAFQKLWDLPSPGDAEPVARSFQAYVKLEQAFGTALEAVERTLREALHAPLLVATADHHLLDTLLPDGQGRDFLEAAVGLRSDPTDSSAFELDGLRLTVAHGA
jgi:hypothetical protein